MGDGRDQQLFALDRTQVLFAVVAAGQLLVLAGLWILLLRNGHPEPAEQATFFIFFLAVPVLTLAAWALTRRWRPLAWTDLRSALPWLMVVTLPAAIALALGLINVTRVVYYSYDAVPRLPPFSLWRSLFGSVLAAGLFFALIALEQRRARAGTESRPIPIWGVALGVGLVTSLFDPTLMVDTLSFSPYLAPAFAMQNGAVPLLDTFSQYGTSFVLIGLLLKLAPNFHAMSALVTAMNVVTGVVVLIIAVRLGRRPLFVFSGGVLLVLFLQSAFLYNITYTPSVFAFRFLPSLLLIATLVHARSRIVTRTSTAAAILCSLWSFESFVTALLTYLIWLGVRCVGERRPWPDALKQTASVIAIFVLPHVALALLYVLAYGHLPRYDIYFELIFVQLKGSYWLMPVEAGICTWILFGFVYASALALAGGAALLGLDANRAAGIAALAAAGAMQFSYYVGRSATPILVFVSVPMLLLVLLACDWALDAWLDRRRRALPVLALPALAAAFLLFAAMGGVFADRMFEPMSKDLSNATLLRGCLAGEPACSLHKIARLLGDRDRGEDGYPTDEAGGSLSYTHAENRTEFNLIRQITAGGNQRILLFGTDPVPVIFHSAPAVAARIVYPPHAAGLVYPAVDGLSPTLSARVITTLDDLREGDVLVRGTLPIYRLDEEALAVIRSRWRLCPRQNGGTVQTWELVAIKKSGCNG
jgi:hypothetical protein